MTPADTSPLTRSEDAPAQAPDPRVPRRHWTPAQRGEALARFATSGLTQAEFCRRAGLSAATFSSWRRKTARGQNSANPAVGGFARVQVAPASPMTTTNAAIVVQVDDGLRVTVPVGTDAVWLGQVLSGLRPR